MMMMDKSPGIMMKLTILKVFMRGFGDSGKVVIQGATHFAH